LGLRDQGKTVFFSTHILPDVEMICDRVGIIVKGKLVAAGRVEELVSSGHTESVEIVWEGVNPQAIPEVTQVAARVLQRGRRCLVVLPGPEQVEQVLAALRSHGGTLISVTPQKRTLEDLFFK
jgi:ABC-2 type transport system ATP-binding protein